MEGYRTAQVGFLGTRAVVDEKSARADLKDKLDGIAGPYNLAPGTADEWGPDRDRGEAMDNAFSYVDHHALGSKVRIRGSRPEQPNYALQRAFMTLGSDVIQVGLTQLGVRYVFADVNPAGPAGGPGAGFDCSGFTLWCYMQVGVVLQHQAEAQRTDPQVNHFDHQRNARAGDLVFMWFPNDRGIASGHASHVGLWVALDRMLDTRSTSEPVSIRGIETGSVVSYGRVKKVNGPLG